MDTCSTHRANPAMYTAVVVLNRPKTLRIPSPREHNRHALHNCHVLLHDGACCTCSSSSSVSPPNEIINAANIHHCALHCCTTARCINQQPARSKSDQSLTSKSDDITDNSTPHKKKWLNPEVNRRAATLRWAHTKVMHTGTFS